ncbi:MAG: class I SAM-dependent methyltransferase [Minisyncoccia bacterium]|jgi:ubiquinone/menaquinone biosynthesis C-methylase UbiE
MTRQAIDEEKYYKRIKNLNIAHYAGETSYYAAAPLRKVERKILDDLPRGAKILDLGCGSGRFSVNAALHGFNVTGIDITPQAVQEAKKKAFNEGARDAKFIEGDMTAIPFPDEFFDYVFCPRFSINAVATFAKRKKAIAEMLRVIKPNGIVFVESFNKLYVGRGLLVPLKNILRDIWRRLMMVGCKLFGKEYSNLLPGDIVYKNNKVLGAPDGYAHLPTIFELKSMIPDDNKVAANFFSIPQVVGNIKGCDPFKFFRYSIWVVLAKK